MNLIIELTGVAALQNEIYAKRPAGVSVMDHKAARLLWDFLQIEAERTRLEQERQTYQRKSREQTQVILDSLPYRIMVVNMDMTIDAVNRTFLKEHGLTYEEAVGQACYTVRYGLDKPCSDYGRPCSITDRLEELKEKGLISTYQEYKDEHGETRFDVFTTAPVYNDQGEVVQVLEASRDVTERIRLEREAQRSRTFFEKLIQSIVDGIVVVDTKGNVLIFNEGMEQLTGYSATEIMKKGHLASFYDIQVAKENMKKMRSDQFGPYGKLNPTSMTIKSQERGRDSGHPVRLAHHHRREGSGQRRSFHGYAGDPEDQEGTGGCQHPAHPVPEDRLHRPDGRRRGPRDQQPSFRHPDLHRASEGKPQGQARDLKDLQEIIDQTLRCKRIASELLEFSRKSAGKISSFSLDDLISKCLALLINKASFQDIVVTTNMDMNMPNLTGDMSQLQQVFTNLFINAADAMEGKGKLHIRATFDRDRSLFVIRVSDTGPGIPQECRDKIFDIFFTTKPAGKGTGLGLSISQNILKIHGGHIAFECPPEGGTVFTVELPLSHPGISSEGAVFLGEEPVFIE